MLTASNRLWTEKAANKWLTFKQKNEINAEEFTMGMVWTDVYILEYYYYIPSLLVQYCRIEWSKKAELCFRLLPLRPFIIYQSNPSSFNYSLAHLCIHPSFIYFRKKRVADLMLAAAQLRYWQSFTRAL